MKTGAEAVLALLPKVSTSSPRKTFAAIGRSLNKLGGSSGVLLSIMFTTISNGVAEDASWSREVLAPAFAAGVATIMNVGGAQPGMRTMVDVLHPISEAFAKGASGADLAATAKAKADATASIRTTAFGRSQYLNEATLEGSKDPGSVAAATVIASLAG